MKIKTGDSAPEFALKDHSGKEHMLRDYRGKWVLLYFYPKDDTPGCTIEACSFRDNISAFKKHNTMILGVSVDTSMSHAKFIKKFALPFTLLADDKKELVRAYGVWGPKNFMGRDYIGTLRTSFLINPDGIIKKVYDGVNPKRHISEILHDLEKFAVE